MLLPAWPALSVVPFPEAVVVVDQVVVVEEVAEVEVAPDKTAKEQLPLIYYSLLHSHSFHQRWYKLL
jgi:hypothetical protein